MAKKCKECGLRIRTTREAHEAGQQHQKRKGGKK